jgi:hypothetical protein
MISAPSDFMSTASKDFTVAAVPTGMKTGVKTSPWSVWMTPARAAQSLASLISVKFRDITPHHGRKTGFGQGWALTIKASHG